MTFGTAYRTLSCALSALVASGTVSPGATGTTVGAAAPSYCTTTSPGTWAGVSWAAAPAGAIAAATAASERSMGRRIAGGSVPSWLRTSSAR